jgi:hypothetical protein
LTSVKNSLLKKNRKNGLVVFSTRYGLLLIKDTKWEDHCSCRRKTLQRQDRQNTVMTYKPEAGRLLHIQQKNEIILVLYKLGDIGNSGKFTMISLQFGDT